MNQAVRSPSPASTIAADLSAGLVVFLVALPLCLGVALASNAPAFSGLVAGVVGGVVVGLLSGSHTSVSGPAAGLTAVVAAQISSLGSFDAFLLAVVLAGALQVGLGFLRAGSIADFVPTSVIKGLLAAIGMILIIKQFPHLLGHMTAVRPVGDEAAPSPDHLLVAAWRTITSLNLHRGAAVIGLLSVVILVLWDKIRWLKALPVPGPLVAVAGGILGNLVTSDWGDAWQIPASLTVQVPVAATVGEFCGFLRLPDFSAIGHAPVYTAAITIAMVASLETLLNLEAVDKLDPQKRTSPPNQELVAQGIGNMAAGLLGGLPITSVIVRSSVNINAGGKTKLATIVHGALLLICVALLPGLLNRIPLSCLAAVLIMTGVKLASPRLFVQQWQAGWAQFVPLLVTVGAILATDLLIGILVGLAFSILFILHSNLRSPLSRTLETHVGGDVLRIELAHQVSFLNRVALWRALEEVPRGGHVVIDARRADYIDADIVAVIREYEREIAPAHGVTVGLLGFKSHYANVDDQIQHVDLATRELQEKLAPDQVLQMLRDGNERFRTGKPLIRDMAELRAGTARDRHPLAVILSGASSRTPLELVFDAGIGDLFCARTIANVLGPVTLATLEYACEVAGAKVLVVLGHTDNKAMELALDAPEGGSARFSESPHLQSTLEALRAAIDPGRLATWPTLDETGRRDLVDELSREHVQHTIEQLLHQSPVLARRVAAGRLRIVGAMYDTHDGAVEFLTATFAKPSREGSPAS